MELIQNEPAVLKGTEALNGSVKDRHQHSACCFLCTMYDFRYFILTLPVKPMYFILKDFVRGILF